MSDPDPASELGTAAGSSAGARPHASDTTCPQCGELVDPDDVFCGACGFLVRAVEPPGGERPRDTAVISDGPDIADAEAGSPEEARSEEAGPGEAGPGGSGSEAAEPERSASRATPDPFPWGTASGAPGESAAPRAAAPPPQGKRFVLQFSTGDSVIVSGAGLVGRNPAAEPGEFFDQLVTIFDASKSVSKTHLEFGQESGRFWVSDRYSTNGSMVRQPDLAPKRCEPGRRYFVARGSRVDIGDQFFVVS